MKRFARLSGTLTLAALLGGVAPGCADRGTPLSSRSVAPPDPAAAHVVARGQELAPLRRNAPATGWRGEFVVSPAGTAVRVPGTGLRMTFPAGAVSASTRVTISAQAGALVAYHFEPHGLRFAAPVQMTQELQGTTAWRTPALLPRMEAGYITVDPYAAVAARGSVRADEVLPARAAADGATVSWEIHHFSGYIASVGRR